MPIGRFQSTHNVSEEHHELLRNKYIPFNLMIVNHVQLLTMDINTFLRINYSNRTYKQYKSLSLM